MYSLKKNNSKRCQNSINHLKDGILHGNNEKCHYDHQYDNKVYVCRVSFSLVYNTLEK